MIKKFACLFMLTMVIFLPVFSFAEQQDDVKTLIEQLSSDNPTLQQEATRKLAELKDPGSVKELVLIMQRGENYYARKNATWILGKILDPQTIDSLRDMLADEDELIAGIAQGALTQFGPQATESLKKGLKSDQWKVQIGCALILANMDDKSGVDILYEALKKGGSDDQKKALAALAVMNDKKALDPVIELLTHKDRKTSKKALDILERWARDHPDIIPDVLSNLRTTDDPELKVQIIASLKGSDSSLIRQDIVREANSPEVTVRTAALQRLRQMKSKENIPVFLKALNDSEMQVRRLAAVSLSEMKAKEAISPLVQLLTKTDKTDPLIINALRNYSPDAVTPKILPLLKDDKEQVRRSAAQVLGVIGAVDALENLVHALKDPSPEVRAAAAQALGRFKDKRAIPHLVAVLDDEDFRVRREATYALVNMRDKTAAYINSILRTGDTENSQRALAVLGEIGDKQSLDILKTALQNNEAAVRVAAAQVLAEFGQQGVNPLLSALHDPDRNVRKAAIESLGAIRDPRAVNPLIKMLNTDLKTDAVKALALIQSEDALPFLFSLLKDSDSNTRALAAEALGSIGDKQATPKLIALLSDKDKTVRLAAIGALGEIGDTSATEPLITLLSDDDIHMRQAAANSLGLFAGKESINPLISVLTVDDKILRLNAIRSLNFVLQRTKEKAELNEQQIGILMSLIESPHNNIRIQTVDVLSRIGALDIGDDLMEIARSGDRLSRISAIITLGTIGEKRASGMMREILEEEQDDTVLTAAIISIGKLGDTKAVTPLIRKLTSENWQIRAQAATALGKIGDERAVPALMRLVDDDVEKVRQKAGEAVGKITGEECPILVALSPFVPFYPYLFIFMVVITVTPALRKRIKPFDRGVSSFFSIFSFFKKERVQWWLAFIVGIGALAFFMYCTFIEITETSIVKGGDDFYSNLALFTIRVFPFFVGGCLLSGLIMKYFATRNILPKSMVGAFTLGGLIPLCSCGAVPLTRAMLTVNVPKRAVIAFLIVAPILNPFVMVMSYGVIGVEYLILRIVAVFLLAIGAGVLIERLVPTEEMDEATPICQLCKSCTSPTATGAASSGLIAGWNLMIYLLPYIFFGLITGAVIATYVPVFMISKYLGSDILGLIAAVTIGIPIFLCSGEEIVMLKPLLDMGLPMGHAIAFTLAANGICVSSIAVLLGVLGRKTTIYLTISFWVGSFVLGYLINIII